jgi:hypothetical protein
VFVRAEDKRRFYSRWDDGSGKPQEGKGHNERFLGRFFGEETELDSKHKSMFSHLFAQGFKGFYSGDI